VKYYLFSKTKELIKKSQNVKKYARIYVEIAFER
jgi:hypothetical protein